MTKELSTSLHENQVQMQVLISGDMDECVFLPNSSKNTLYKTELCKHYIEHGRCRYELKCQFAHGVDELRGVLRHSKYKTTICKSFIASGMCAYGTRCRFVHERDEREHYEISSSTASESDEDDLQKDLSINPYSNGSIPLDLSMCFGGTNQLSLSPLLPLEQVTDPITPRSSFLEFDLDAEPVVLEKDLSRSDESPGVYKFSRLSIFRSICNDQAED